MSSGAVGRQRLALSVALSFVLTTLLASIFYSDSLWNAQITHTYAFIAHPRLSLHNPSLHCCVKWLFDLTCSQ